MKLSQVPGWAWVAVVGVGVVGYAMWHSSSTAAINRAQAANYPAWTAANQPASNTQYQLLDAINPKVTRVAPVDTSNMSRWMGAAGSSGRAAMCLGAPCQQRGMWGSYAPHASVSGSVSADA